MRDTWEATILVLLCYCCASIKCQQFYCHASSNSTMRYFLFPNISDIHFEDSEVVTWNNLTLSRGNNVRLFIIDPSTEQNCTGNVTFIKYCYWITPNQVNSRIMAFKVVLGNKVESNFTVSRIFSVFSTPRDQICTTKKGRLQNMVCCDVHEMSSRDSFHISTLQFVFGIHFLKHQVVFRNTLVVSYTRESVQVGTTYPLQNRRRRTFPLIQFVIEPNMSPVVTPDDGEAPQNDSKKDHPSISGDNTGAVVGGILAGVLVLLLVALCITVVCIRLKRRKKSLTLASRGQREFSNAIYGEAWLGYDIWILANAGEQTNNDLEYADVGPAVIIRTKEQPQPMASTFDEEEDIYMVPPSSEDALHSQLDGMAQNIVRDSLSLGDSLGSGQFGAVYQGVWRCGQEEVQVAVKTLKKGSKEEDRVKFLQEAAIMGQFKHPNVVTMYGVVRDDEPILLVLELLVKGDLRGHLLKARVGTGEGIDGHILLSYCRQVVSGMVYLSSKAFVHRDLAARNILMSEDEICKIADFGMSRDLMYESFYVSHGGMIPVKWTAPEALYYKTYSTASDVWSFGALMYEIWSVGHKPFETLANDKVLSAVSSGVRLAPPPGCPRKLYSIMIDCWNPESSKRPSFMDLSRQLSLPDSKLLLWSEEDRSAHPEADRLGGDLQCAQELYEDLQTKYLGM